MQITGLFVTITLDHLVLHLPVGEVSSHESFVCFGKEKGMVVMLFLGLLLSK